MKIILFLCLILLVLTNWLEFGRTARSIACPNYSTSSTIIIGKDVTLWKMKDLDDMRKSPGCEVTIVREDNKRVFISITAGGVGEGAYGGITVKLLSFALNDIIASKEADVKKIYGTFDSIKDTENRKLSQIRIGEGPDTPVAPLEFDLFKGCGTVIDFNIYGDHTNFITKKSGSENALRNYPHSTCSTFYKTSFATFFEIKRGPINFPNADASCTKNSLFLSNVDTQNRVKICEQSKLQPNPDAIIMATSETSFNIKWYVNADDVPSGADSKVVIRHPPMKTGTIDVELKSTEIKSFKNFQDSSPPTVEMWKPGDTTFKVKKPAKHGVIFIKNWDNMATAAKILGFGASQKVDITKDYGTLNPPIYLLVDPAIDEQTIFVSYVAGKLPAIIQFDAFQLCDAQIGLTAPNAFVFDSFSIPLANQGFAKKTVKAVPECKFTFKSDKAGFVVSMNALDLPNAATTCFAGDLLTIGKVNGETLKLCKLDQWGAAKSKKFAVSPLDVSIIMSGASETARFQLEILPADKLITTTKAPTTTTKQQTSIKPELNTTLKMELKSANLNSVVAMKIVALFIVIAVLL